LLSPETPVRYCLAEDTGSRRADAIEASAVWRAGVALDSEPDEVRRGPRLTAVIVIAARDARAPPLPPKLALSCTDPLLPPPLRPGPAVTAVMSPVVLGACHATVPGAVVVNTWPAAPAASLVGATAWSASAVALTQPLQTLLARPAAGA
jgi:hypothetical protein